jgi:hypothetical protein
MFLKKRYRGKSPEQREEFKRKYAWKTKECIGYLPRQRVLYEGKYYWVRIRCEKKFETRDPTQVFCSDSCRLNFHMNRRIEERQEKHEKEI